MQGTQTRRGAAHPPNTRYVARPATCHTRTTYTHTHHTRTLHTHHTPHTSHTPHILHTHIHAHPPHTHTTHAHTPHIPHTHTPTHTTHTMHTPHTLHTSGVQGPSGPLGPQTCHPGGGHSEVTRVQDHAPAPAAAARACTAGTHLGARTYSATTAVDDRGSQGRSVEGGPRAGGPQADGACAGGCMQGVVRCACGLGRVCLSGLRGALQFGLRTAPPRAPGGTPPPPRLLAPEAPPCRAAYLGYT